MQCYKNLITKLWTTENWTGYNAKWIDLCELGSTEIITPISWDLNAARFNKDLIGDKKEHESQGTSYDTDKCTPGVGLINVPWSSSTIYGSFFETLEANLMSYIFTRLQGSLKTA